MLRRPRVENVDLRRPRVENVDLRRPRVENVDLRIFRRPRVENVDLRRPRVGNSERLRLLHQFIYHIHPTRLQRVLHSSIHTCITGKCLYLLNKWYNTVRSLHTGCLDKGKDICSLGYGGASVVDSKLPVPSRARSTNS